MVLVNTALTLQDLPPPPEGKTGWPWTEQTEVFLDKMPDGSDWPRISIVTPNYNYGNFIEETIRSVLLQGYPNLEYIVIDGGSTDNSIEIIRKYEKWLFYWVSEKDSGQSNAINKGISKSTGIIFNWINSDDILNLASLYNVACIWRERNPDILVGSGRIITNKKCIEWIPHQSISALDLALCFQGEVGMSQPSTFLNLNFVKRVGGLSENFHYIIDYSLYINLLVSESISRLTTVNMCLSTVKLHEGAKTVSSWSKFEMEAIQMLSSAMAKFPANERKDIKQHIYQLSVQVAVRNAVMNLGFAGLISLLILLLRNPLFMFSRFYLGALKNKFVEATGR
ncbi:glycosyl transferase, family 2 [Pseudanabaena sp. lw0831]|uniref:glycosyltransferase family 2 protein n=1 Tax=Pseudanabaena sp. lw0831 TaxID=1357935 RepID=UPI001A186DC4|nr:glycosyltransferase family 2 protein [Pseudanabaena sp. lw0831]GBO54663.1 glycosyl transferase, family 2 [Pseudanabaena sp. lw0831]